MLTTIGVFALLAFAYARLTDRQRSARAAIIVVFLALISWVGEITISMAVLTAVGYLAGSIFNQFSASITEALKESKWAPVVARVNKLAFVVFVAAAALVAVTGLTS
ncbi:hypothetical protein GCM10010402_53680 [Actinomadura luteofluorescens]|uniref:hypothetical protein n=1 Tax=Actinomadura luteofluorescens TaxID=46163 RepID=UPI002164B4DA|nr:hypothetical protein [Actinomadura glauciflava]MCR3745121.1 hypothetical protein [Actinomadura glauciflava]